MTFPIPAVLLNRFTNHFISGQDALQVRIDGSGDIDAGANGFFIKTTLGTKYNFSAGLSTAVAPTAANDVTNKSYVDALFNGQRWKNAVKVATTGNITLSGLQTIDSVALANDDRVGVINQSTPSQNGIYAASSGSWSRVADLPVGQEATGVTFHVSQGATWGNKTLYQTTEGAVGTAGLVFVEISSGTMPTAGNGLQATGNVWAVLAANTSITVSGSGVTVNLATNSGLEINSGLRVNFNGLTEKTTVASGDWLGIWSVADGAMRKASKANFLAGLAAGSSRFPEYTLTGTDVTNKSATIPGLAGLVGTNHLVFYSGLACEASDATLNPATGVVSWNGLSLDGLAKAGAKIVVWGRV